MITFSGHQKTALRGKNEFSSCLPSRPHLTQPFRKDIFVKKTTKKSESPAILFASRLTKELGLADEPNRMHPNHIPDHTPLVARNPIIHSSSTPFTQDAIFIPVIGKPLRRFPLDDEPTYQMEQAFRCLENLHAKKIIILYSGDYADRYLKDLHDYIAYRNIPDHSIDPNKIVLIDIPKRYKLPGLELETDHFVYQNQKRTNDVHLKRNIGLAVAKLLNLKHIMFLDEDVVLPSFHIQQEDIPTRLQFNHYEAQLAQAFKEDGRKVVGSTADGILIQNHKTAVVDRHWTPDNSLLCLVNRILGNPQKTFIGSGAMNIRISDDLPFFPYAYNEDWLFVAPLMDKDPLSVAKISSVLHWNKGSHFIIPSSGGVLLEEFPDIFAESILRAIKLSREYGPGTSDMPITFERIITDPDYWKYMVKFRLDFIGQLQKQFENHIHSDADTTNETNPFSRLPIFQRKETIRRTDEILSLAKQTVEQNQDIWPTLLTQYATIWLKDQKVWHNWYTRLPQDDTTLPSDDLTAALNHLNLEAHSAAEKIFNGFSKH